MRGCPVVTAELRLVPEQLGDEREADLVAWLVPDGARVEPGQVVAELSTARVIVELLAPAGGRLRQDRRAGELVAAGDLLGAILG